MKRLTVLYLMLCSSPAIAQNDPTFSGMANLLHCSISHRAICSGNYCSDFSMSVNWNNIWIDVQKRLISSQRPLSNQDGLPIRIIEISDAGINQVLFQKFEYVDREGNTREMMINFYPNRGQTMDVRFGIVAKPKSSELSQRLAIEKVIETGQCEIQ
jgi:hypothetical protein